MRLSWDTGYEDYTDLEHWEPKFAWLKSFAQNLDTNASMGPEDLRDTLEVLEELMRFYCSQQDLKGLEPVMRKFAALLQRLPEAGPEDLYLQAFFLRLNGMLYRSVGQNRKALEQYDRSVAAAGRCYSMLENCRNLDPDQKFYVAWNCVECYREAAEVRDLLMDAPGAMEILRQVMPILYAMDAQLLESPGIADKASELYLGAGGLFWQNQDAEMGRYCFRSSARLLRELDRLYDSDFYLARAIWADSIHGTMAMLLGGDASVILQCEQDAAEYLQQRLYAQRRDKAIVDAARASATLQRAAYFQQNGQQAEAIAQFQIGIGLLEQSYDTLTAELGEQGGYRHGVINGIASRVHGAMVGAKQSLGVTYYQNDDPETARELLREVLERLNNKNGHRVVGTSGTMLQAATLEYLSLIAAGFGNYNEADFYGTQGADMALGVGRETGNPMIWEVALVCCSQVAEVALAMKNKAKAQQYAALGLEACDALERAMPDHPHLVLRGNLVKFHKKATRRFF